MAPNAGPPGDGPLLRDQKLVLHLPGRAWELSVQETDPLTRTAAASRYWRNPGVSRVGWTRHSQTVELVLDGPPQWAEVSYPLSGQDWVLRVEWEVEP